jgi:hypothetical protein
MNLNDNFNFILPYSIGGNASNLSLEASRNFATYYSGYRGWCAENISIDEGPDRYSYTSRSSLTLTRNWLVPRFEIDTPTWFVRCSSIETWSRRESVISNASLPAKHNRDLPFLWVIPKPAVVENGYSYADSETIAYLESPLFSIAVAGDPLEGSQGLNGTNNIRHQRHQHGVLRIFSKEQASELIPELENKVPTIKITGLTRATPANPKPSYSLKKQTKAQILSGQRLFSYIQIVTVVANDGTETTENLISVGIVGDEILLNSRYSAICLLALIEFITSTEWINDIKYPNQAIVRNFSSDPEFCLYSQPTVPFNISNIPDTSHTSLKNREASDLTVLNSSESVTRAPFARTYLAAVNKVESYRDQIKSIEQERKRHEQLILEHTSYIAERTRKIDRLQKDILTDKILLREERQKALIASEAILKQTDIVEVLTPQLDGLKELFNSKLEKYTAEGSSVPALDKYLSNMGIKITKLTFFDAEGETIKSQDVDVTGILMNRYAIKSMSFETTRPMNINVLDTNKQVVDTRVGGPYRVRLKRCAVQERFQVRINALSHDSIIGIEPVTNTGIFYAKAHPHTGCSALKRDDYVSGLESLVSQDIEPCLGEAEAALATASKTNNIKMILFAMLSWLKNAYKDDQWGRTAAWFPKPRYIANMLLGEELAAAKIAVSNNGISLIAYAKIAYSTDYSITWSHDGAIVCEEGISYGKDQYKTLLFFKNKEEANYYMRTRSQDWLSYYHKYHTTDWCLEILNDFPAETETQEQIEEINA